LFNGVDLTDWWQNCNSTHGSSPGGATFRMDSVRKALYTAQGGESGGSGVLMTKAKFGDYELVFDYWPDWGNEAALFNRTDTNGRAYSTTLGYMGSTALGGAWGENGIGTRDYRPFDFDSIETEIRIPGNGSSYGGWTEITRKLKAAGETVPCPESGCTQEDWLKLWDFDNWNQVRVTFHGGNGPQDPIHLRSWFRKLGALDWVPLLADTMWLKEIKPGYIGLLVHGGSRFSGPRGTWYRNMRWRPWTPSLSTAVRGFHGDATQRLKVRVDGVRQGFRIVFPEAELRRDLRILSVDGKSMAELRGIRGEAFVSTAGWKRGVYLVRADGGGRGEWARVLLP
ncbi:MAG: family 16 glycoside hydrolase, partial [Fibrobacteria bacterium]